jgi:hypothetical protein
MCTFRGGQVDRDDLGMKTRPGFNWHQVKMASMVQPVDHSNAPR